MTKSALGRIPLHGMQLPVMANFTEVAVSTIEMLGFFVFQLTSKTANA